MSSPEDRSDEDRSGPIAWLRWFATTEEGTAAYVRDVLTSAGAVVLVGLVLFGVSGIWPPMVAVESPSMTPHMKTGDLVFVMEEHRFAADAAVEGTGVVTTQVGERVNYGKFSQPGDVVVYRPDGSGLETPIIHRARFWVEDGENWYEEANPAFLAGADDCEELANCPAPHAGFVTKGDANPQYDQVGEASAISEPVRPSWVIGTAEFRIPWLGWIRLAVSKAAGATVVAANVGGSIGAGAGVLAVGATDTRPVT
jgi:signal peptidase